MKKQLLEAIKQKLDYNLRVCYEAMQAAQASANAETKSSAGDKYETGRAMGQIERDLHAQQYEKIRIERQIVEKINPDTCFERIALGALAQTSTGWFFVSTSLGQITVENKVVMVVSAKSPIGTLLMGKRVGESFHFQEKKGIVEIIS